MHIPMHCPPMCQGQASWEAAKTKGKQLNFFIRNGEDSLQGPARSDVPVLSLFLPTGGRRYTGIQSWPRTFRPAHTTCRMPPNPGILSHSFRQGTGRVPTESCSSLRSLSIRNLIIGWRRLWLFSRIRPGKPGHPFFSEAGVLQTGIGITSSLWGAVLL